MVIDPQAKDDDGNTVNTKGKVNLILKPGLSKRRLLDGSQPTYLCISKNEKSGVWDNTNCNLKEIENSDGTKSTSCLCNTPSLTTIMDDVD